jgi:hypothetical protein
MSTCTLARQWRPARMEMHMANTPWRTAIEKVLRDRGEAMHYTEIADEIIQRSLREDVGATPSSTVNSMITTDINANGDASVFVRVSRGSYVLRDACSSEAEQAEKSASAVPESSPGIVQALGMYWRRDYVTWSTAPRLYGQQQTGASVVDLASQLGIYLLYDTREAVYVGRALDQPLGRRLFQHTSDRLNGRWDRFSWFGLCPVTDKGEIRSPSLDGLTLGALVATLEALLIEGLEPRQNRKRGDEFRAVEYQQVVDPAIGRERKKRMLQEIASLIEKE